MMASSCIGYELPPSTERGGELPFSPAVMLLPNATKLCTASAGCGGTSVTLNEQAADRTPSVALQFTGVTPSGYEVFDGGEHVIVIGGVPPVAVGDGYVTSAVGVPILPSLTSAGHVRTISATGGGCGEGPVEEPHATHSSNGAATAERRILGVTVR